MQNIENYVVIAFGIYLISTRKWQIKQYAKRYEKTKNKFTPKAIKLYESLAILVGFVFILIGILSLLGLLTARS